MIGRMGKLVDIQRSAIAHYPAALITFIVLCNRFS